jgi:hypothetical protein
MEIGITTIIPTTRRAHPYRCPKDFGLDMSMDEIMNSESMKKFLAKYADIP